MNTTTNTRGVSEAMYRHAIQAWIDRERTHGHDLPAQLLAALEAALSAEPAAQGEEGFDARKYVRHMADVLEAGGDLFKVDADLLRLAAAINKASNIAPPAQPADSKVIGADLKVKPGERVPDPETACAMWIKPTTTVAESDAFLAGARAMLATTAAQAEGGKGVEG